MKKLTAIFMIMIITAMMVMGCTNADSNDKVDSSGKAENGKVYYLNFKPEVDAIWQEMAKKFTKETGIECKIATAASGKYEMTLETEITKDDAPTLFQINGPIGYERWADYCADLTDTGFAGYMNDTAKTLAVTDSDGKVYGVPYAIEGYGIIYNNAIMDKYFASANKSKDITATSAEEIKNFDTLKAVVEDMTKLKSELGIDGVFASTSLASGEDWRWQTHLANMPMFYECKDNNTTVCPETVEFKYDKNFKNIFDLYINNSCTDVKKLSEKTVDGSMAEFALGKVAMVQNGNWAWNTISSTDGNIVKEDDVKYMPIYTGIDGEENQGICIGTENYLCINKEASADDQAATLKFLEWVFNSSEGKDYIVNKLQFNAPFTTFTEDEQPKDPLAKEVARYASNGTDTVTWIFTTFPSEDFKTAFGGLLLNYTLGDATWDDVKKGFVETWAVEYANN